MLQKYFKRIFFKTTYFLEHVKQNFNAKCRNKLVTINSRIVNKFKIKLCVLDQNYTKRIRKKTIVAELALETYVTCIEIPVFLITYVLKLFVSYF